MMAYRRNANSDTWHFCTNCSLWPTTNPVERSAKPTTGELCNQCRAKDTAGTCRR